MQLRKRNPKRDRRASLEVSNDEVASLRKSRDKLPKMKGVRTMFGHFIQFLSKHVVVEGQIPVIESVAEIPNHLWTDALKAQFLETIWLSYKSPSQVCFFEFVRIYLLPFLFSCCSKSRGSGGVQPPSASDVRSDYLPFSAFSFLLFPLSLFLGQKGIQLFQRSRPYAQEASFCAVERHVAAPSESVGGCTQHT
jgi:hypothetical protein